MYVSFDAYCGLFSIRSKKTVSAIEKLLSQVILYQNKLAILRRVGYLINTISQFTDYFAKLFTPL